MTSEFQNKVVIVGRRNLRRVTNPVEGRFDYWKSRHVSLDENALPTVCVALGPYRNLTTLTAGMLALHPECQVLNHAAVRIFTTPQVNFLEKPSDARFVAFVRHAIYLSQGGKRGPRGGSIVHSHAFDDEGLRDTYRERYGDLQVKETVRSIFWKDSLRVANYIRDNRVDLAGLFARNDRLRFLLPIRNPVNCALSNLKTGHYRQFRDLDGHSPEQIVDRVVGEIAWFFDLAVEYPGRFFHFYEDGIDSGMLSELADFLCITRDERWVSDVVEHCAVKPSYAYDADLAEYCRRSFGEQLQGHPEVQERLLRLVSSPD